MKCDSCDREATVHEVTVRNGVKIEKHLCEVCAEQLGISIQPNAPINELLKQFMTQGIGPGTPAAPATRAAACPRCRTTFAEFKTSGLLGCAECYRAFEAQLMPLIERAQEGGVQHAGKVPQRIAPDVAPTEQGERAGHDAAVAARAERERMLGRIRAELESAISQEHYEHAAKLRDALRQLELDAPPGTPRPREQRKSAGESTQPQQHPPQPPPHHPPPQPPGAGPQGGDA